MLKSETNRRAALGGTAILAIAMGLIASPVFAQTRAAPVAAQAEKAADDNAADIVVTGSRLGGSGFNAPTPVTVLDSDRLAKQGITNIADGLNQIPAFRPTSTPTTGGLFFNNIGANFADLRGLGAPRTLVLVDGRRFVPSNTSGVTDLNLIPSSLIARSEVVTGGASAAYGSDAISGVINLKIDTKFTGIKGQVQAGVSQQGDGANYQVSLAGGFALGERGHIVLGGEWYRNEGIGDIYTRSWGRQEWQVIGNPNFAVNGQARNIIAPAAHTGNMSVGGVVTAGPLRGIAFGADGQTRNFVYGDYAAVGNLLMSGGEGAGETSFLKYVPLSVPVERYSLFTHADYALGDNLSAFVELSYGHSRGEIVSAQPRNFVPVATSLNNTITVFRDNPYLPAAFVTQMVNTGQTSVALGRISNDIGPARGFSSNTTWRGAFGLKGDVGPVNWDFYYQYGRNDHDQRLDNALIAANFRKATDAVTNGSGQIVCRVNQVSVTDAACQPMNIIGIGRHSAASLAYVTGSSTQVQVTDQHVAAINFRAKPFSTWAGPVAVAFGGEYRSDRVSATIDAVSAAAGFQTGNTSAANGSNNVKEAYLEVGVPVLRNGPFGTADLNGALRRTDYHNSGAVTTWKVGGTWDTPLGFRLRGAVSRDIRAPNLGELFTTQITSTSLIIDPRTSLQTLSQVIGGGNLGLVPEIADSYTVGAVIKPGFIHGLRLSVDYYDIRIKGAIGNYGAQNIVNRCFAGDASFCALVNNGAGLGASITRVFNGFLNINTLATRGIDIEAAYDLPLSQLQSGWKGNMSFRLMATHVIDMITTDSGGAIDRAGQTGVPVGDLGGPSSPFVGGGGVPDWTLDGFVSYAGDPLGLTLHGRYIAPGKFGATFIAPGDPGYSAAAANSINDNTVDGRFYLDLNTALDVRFGQSRKFQFFFGITNLLDKDPPVAPGAHITNPVLFDVVGRAFKFGARFTL
ncbi:MAG: hypothetical protein JWR80_1561 [Bradyrhizobium sp.]|nr:hypothetical protein [Bradyrhizobium sp.]